MKFSVRRALLSLATLAHLTTAATKGFIVYESQDAISGTGANMYYFFDGHPDCKAVFNARGVFEQEKIKNDKEGVICDGKGCYNGNPKDITRFEFQAQGYGHYTIVPFHVLGVDIFALMDTNGATAGACWATKEDDFICGAPFAMTGVSIFHCLAAVP